LKIKIFQKSACDVQPFSSVSTFDLVAAVGQMSEQRRITARVASLFSSK